MIVYAAIDKTVDILFVHYEIRSNNLHIIINIMHVHRIWQEKVA